MAHPIARILEQSSLTAVGLMSGTSMDGVDAALVGLATAADSPAPVLREFSTIPYPEELRESLEDAAGGAQLTAEDLARLHTGVAVSFSGAFFDVCRRAGIEPASVDYIGSHGQTVAHAPPVPGEGTPITGTLQLGPPGMIAAITGVTTVGDFRGGDMALGGQGAPLAPAADWLLRRSAKEDRVILNLGGIGNLTWLGAGGNRDAVVAFDTGPGNMVIDTLYRALFTGEGERDEGGAHALEGTASEAVVEAMMKHPYFAQAPPKSAGHREFGPTFAWRLQQECESVGCSRSDSLATAAALTVRAVGDAMDRFIAGRGANPVVYVTGGGVYNEAIMSGLRKVVGANVRAIDTLGIPAVAKEAVDFAVLARETLFDRPNVLPQVTGASQALVLGAVAAGSRL